MVSAAQVFAEKAHSGQMRKYCSEPYITHPIRVAALVKEWGGSPAQVDASYLHDTVEDCDVTIEDIEDNFGVEVALLVRHMTFPKYLKAELTLNRFGYKAVCYHHASLMCPDAVFIKLADRLDNLESFKPGRSKEETAFYRDAYLHESEELLKALTITHRSKAVEALVRGAIWRIKQHVRTD